MSERSEFLRLAVKGAHLALDPSLGNLRELGFTSDGREFAPLHTAHWVDTEQAEADTNLALVERRLSGDFLCAPFGQTDDPDVPIHGWSANSAWNLVDQSSEHLRLELAKPLHGAKAFKTLALKPGHPVLYQTHELQGGSGGLTVAHHPMMRLTAGDRMFFSPKQIAMTPDHPLVPGRGIFKYPARSTQLTDFPARSGSIDLTCYPSEQGHEDFVTLVEADVRGIGWTAILRQEQDDIIVVLKDASVLPLTMLWFSNGGRDQYPWDGRHVGVLGVEDGIAAGADGYLAALGENAIRRLGVPTTLEQSPGTTHTIKHAIVNVARPDGWREITNVEIAVGGLTITNADGASVTTMFDTDFFST